MTRTHWIVCSCTLPITRTSKSHRETWNFFDYILCIKWKSHTFALQIYRLLHNLTMIREAKKTECYPRKDSRRLPRRPGDKIDNGAEAVPRVPIRLKESQQKFVEVKIWSKVEVNSMFFHRYSSHNSCAKLFNRIIIFNQISHLFINNSCKTTLMK